MRAMLAAGVVALALSACASDDADEDSTPDPADEVEVADTSACRAAFEAYADAWAEVAETARRIDEVPLQHATLTMCKSSDEWVEIAADHQGPATKDLFPPLGDLENVLSVYCAEVDPDAPACS